MEFKFLGEYEYDPFGTAIQTFPAQVSKRRMRNFSNFAIPVIASPGVGTHPHDSVENSFKPRSQGLYLSLSIQSPFQVRREHSVKMTSPPIKKLKVLYFN